MKYAKNLNLKSLNSGMWAKGALVAAILLFITISVSAYSLPDMKPVLIFNASTSGTTAVLTAVAVDSLTDAGISKIELYKDNQLLDTKNCNFEKTCVFTKVIFEKEKTNHDFYAKATDISGQTTQSGVVQISFEGIADSVNIPPVIYEDSYEQRIADVNYTWNGSDENATITRGRIITFNAEVKDLDDENLDFKWFLSGPLASLSAQSASEPIAEGSKQFSMLFDEEGDYTVKFVASDGSKQATKEWIVSVRNATIHGTIYDIDTGLPVSGAEIYFYDVSVYDPESDSGDYSALQPKEIPDTVTDSNGNYDFYLPVAGPLASIYNMVVQGSDEKDFNIYVEKGKEKKHDVYLDENRPVTNFNAEGHIAYSGKYEHKNNYTAGDFVDFFMFGVNNGETNETITFAVQNHASIGGPTAPIIYTGNISNPSESLTVNAGEKKHARFSFEIPAGLDEGKYDIHIIWNNETWHHIGNFFIMNDTTAPEVWFDSDYNCLPEACPVFAGQEEASFKFHTQDPGQEGTIRILEIGFSSPTTLDVSTQDNTGNAINISGISGTIKVTDLEGTPLNVSNSTGWPKDGLIKINYTDSGHYNLALAVADKAGNPANASINVTVYATESQVNATAVPIYELFEKIWPFGIYYDFYVNLSTSPWLVSAYADRWEDLDRMGDEYITNDSFYYKYNQSVMDMWQALDSITNENYGCTGPEYLIPIHPMTLEEYNYTLKSGFTHLKCNCNFQSAEGPDCNWENFIPEIYYCGTDEGYYRPCRPGNVVMSNASSGFSIAVADPNNDAFSIYWYLDDLLVQTNGTDYMLESNASLIGNHTVKAVVLDWSNENVSINKQGYGPHNSAEWNVVIN